MTEYRVELENYAGPLDLLLYLVKRHEIDLYDIPIATLTDQYLAYLRQLEQIDINLAGEFLVMAATLLEIKSQMLLPRPQEGDETHPDKVDDETGMSMLDPRYELVQQLLEYKRFKDAANELESRREQWEKRFPAVPAKVKRDRAAEEPDDAATIDLDLEDISLHDLTEAFARILETIGSTPGSQHAVIDDDTPIALHQEDLLDRLQREGPITLQRVFEGRRRIEMVGLFIATLELVRQRRIRVYQDRADDQIKLEPRPESDRELPPDEGERDWRDPETGEVTYDWPSEQARLRAERRAKLRATYAAKKAADDQATQAADDEDLIDLDEDDDPAADHTISREDD